MKRSIKKQQKAKSRQDRLRRQKAKQSSQPRIFRQYPGLNEALSPHHPVHACLINKDWQEAGMASIFLYRRAPSGLVAADFLVDLWGLGLKDSSGDYALPMHDVDKKLEKAQMALIPCDPDLAAKLVYGGVAWAKRYHFQLPKDYTLWLRLLSPPPEIDLSLFGRDGKPELILSDADVKRPFFEKEFFDPTILMEGLTIGDDGPSRAVLERIGEIKRVLLGFSLSDAFADEEKRAWKIFKQTQRMLKPAQGEEKILFRDWFALEYEMANGYRIVEHFLDDYAEIMSDEVAEMLEEWPDVMQSLFEVKSVQGDGFVLYNLVNEVHYTVYPTLFEISSQIQQGFFLLARILPIGNSCYIFSGELSILPCDGSDQGRAEIYRTAIRIQTHNPRQAFRDNEEKLHRSMERVMKIIRNLSPSSAARR